MTRTYKRREKSIEKTIRSIAGAAETQIELIDRMCDSGQLSKSTWLDIREGLEEIADLAWKEYGL